MPGVSQCKGLPNVCPTASLFLRWILHLSDGPVERFRLASSRKRLGDLSAQPEKLAVGPRETHFQGGYTHSSVCKELYNAR
jgi:hypothetical protein